MLKIQTFGDTLKKVKEIKLWGRVRKEKMKISSWMTYMEKKVAAGRYLLLLLDSCVLNIKKHLASFHY